MVSSSQRVEHSTHTTRNSWYPRWPPYLGPSAEIQWFWWRAQDSCTTACSSDAALMTLSCQLLLSVHTRSVLVHFRMAIGSMGRIPWLMVQVHSCAVYLVAVVRMWQPSRLR